MKKTLKKGFAAIMAVVVLLTSIGVSLCAYATALTTVDVNKKMLETILNDRHWVIETLIHNDFTNNPYAVINPSFQGGSIMEEALTNYQEHAAFKALMDAMEVFGNTGQYVEGAADKVCGAFGNWFGTTDEVDKTVSSVAELKYESILNDVLLADYTSTWGDTLYEQNMQLETLKQRGKILGKIGSYQGLLKDTLDLSLNDESILDINPFDENASEYDVDIESYTDHFLSAYQADLAGYLESSLNIPGLELSDAQKEMALAAGAHAMVCVYERVALPEASIDIDYLFYDGFLDDIKAELNDLGTVLNIAQKTTDVAITLEALLSQKETTVKTFERIIGSSTDDGLDEVLQNYLDLFNAAGDDKLMAYETICAYLRTDSPVINVATNYLTKKAPKLLIGSTEKFLGLAPEVLSGPIAKLTGIVGTAVWVADKALNLEDTAKKIYLCKYVDRIIAEVVKTYSYDLAVYETDKTDENAEKVLMDLQFLMQLRLFGETQAYGSMCAQLDSLVGILLGSATVEEYFDSRYQACIDALMGCSATPISNKIYELSSNQMITIDTQVIDEKEYVYAHIATLPYDGNNIKYIPEVNLRLMGGIDLNGATLVIHENVKNIYIPLIQNDAEGGTVVCGGENIIIDSIINSGELTVELRDNAEILNISNLIENSGTLTITNNTTGSSVENYDIVNSGTVTLTNCQLDCKGLVTNNGTINGSVNICGDGSLAYENAYFKMTKKGIFGTGTISKLYFNSYEKTGFGIDGTQTVTEYFYNPSARLRNGEKIVLTGNCQIYNNKANNSLSFRDYTNTAPLTVGGSGYIYGNVTFGGDTEFSDSLYVTSGCGTLTLNGETTVKGDFNYAGGTISGSDYLKLCGNASITASEPSISNLYFVGLTGQTLNSSQDLTVSNLNNSNLSLSGVKFDSKIYVTGALHSSSMSNYEKGENVVLTGTARLNGNTIKGSVSAQNWTCADSVNIKGTLYASDELSVPEGVTVKVINYFQSGGNLALAENTAIMCSGDFKNGATVTNNGTITVSGDSKISGTLTGGTYSAKGDLGVSATFTPDKLELEGKTAQNFSNTGTTTVKYLVLDNPSQTGINIGSVITVTESYTNNCNALTNGKNIILTGNAKYFSNGICQSDFTVSGDFVVPAGETLSVNGNVYINSGATVTVSEGAQFIVNKSLVSSSGTINVEENGLFQINDYYKSSGDTVNVEGNVLIKGDVKLSSTTLGGSGLVTFKGDLSTSSVTFNNPNIAFVSKVPQKVSGAAINVNDLLIENGSKTGIDFSSTVNYYGTYTKGESVITGEDKIVSQA